jgi:hypothetical protein
MDVLPIDYYSILVMISAFCKACLAVLQEGLLNAPHFWLNENDGIRKIGSAPHPNEMLLQSLQANAVSAENSGMKPTYRFRYLLFVYIYLRSTGLLIG